MAEDWTAVGDAITKRLGELRMTQLDLAAQSKVSPATIREIQYNRMPRRRHPRTLEALSEALQWEAGHLSAVLAGEPGGRHAAHDDASLQAQVDELRARLDEVQARLARLEDVQPRLTEVEQPQWGG
jgi:transcriptional regulator with XRE-family HTH domain